MSIWQEGAAYGGGLDIGTDLRVDDHVAPITELGRLLDLHFLYFERPDPATLLPLEGALAGEVTDALVAVGYPPGDHDSLDDAFAAWSGVNNYEERTLPGQLDPIVWAILQEQASAAASVVTYSIVAFDADDDAVGRRRRLQGDVRRRPRAVGRRRRRCRRHPGVPRSALRVRGARARCATADSADGVVGRLTTDDPESVFRQLGVVDADGRAATFTGDQCTPWAGGLSGDSWAVQGNILAGPHVVEAMAEAYAGASGPFAERLLTALLAGDESGGDRRGRQSACGQDLAAARRGRRRPARRRRCSSASTTPSSRCTTSQRLVRPRPRRPRRLLRQPNATCRVGDGTVTWTPIGRRATAPARRW